MAGVTPSGDLARATVRALRMAGVHHIVLCPGSRSAPLAYAVQDCERALGGPRLHMRHDERVAAFTALGMACTGTPSAVVTTSGTAVANLHPAVLEAHHAGLPLVLVTADRPRRLRGTWANQTSELQEGLFGAAVRARLDLEADVDVHLTQRQHLLNRCLSAATGADGGRPGPVHLNLGFTEPLVPEPDESAVEGQVAVQSPPSRGQAGQREQAPNPVRLTAGPPTVVIAGAATNPVAGRDARRLAESTGWPLLAEPSSGARHGKDVIGPYRLLLDHDTLTAPIERAVVYGRATLSRPVSRLIERPDVQIVLVSPWPDWPEPGRAVTRATSVEPDLSGQAIGADASSDFSRHWHSVGRRAQRAVDVVLDQMETMCGPMVARAVVRSLQPGETLVAAASNPIRDLDLAAGSLPDSAMVLANRGLSGIDGTLSTATGHALATSRGVRALVGDLAFLHDLNALLAAPQQSRPDLLVVVLNDEGGGIFSLLEYGELAERDVMAGNDFERLFGTPHHADLAALCRGYRVPHHRVADRTELESVLARPVSGTQVIEVPASRHRLRDLHAQLREAVARAV